LKRIPNIIGIYWKNNNNSRFNTWVFGEMWMTEEKKSSKKDVKGTMTVQEAGRKGGMKTAQTHGKDFYEEIGHKGGQRVKELIEEGKKAKALSAEKE
jgi:uncharacterized protein